MCVRYSSLCLHKPYNANITILHSLKLKSSIASPTSPGHAVLCTPSQTFSIRQVQTSNSLYLLQPSLTTPHSSIQASDEFPEIPQSGLTIASTVTSYLELLPTAPDPRPQLYKSLPVYHGWGEADNDGGALKQTEKLPGYHGLLEHIPISDAELLRAWTDAGGFILSSVPYRPSAALSLQLLNRISVASSISQIALSDFSKPFTISALWNAIDEDSLPVPLLEAFVRRVSDSMDGALGNDIGWLICKNRLACCVGRLLLEADHDQRRLVPPTFVKATEYLSLPGFLKKWADILLDQAVECDISLELLKGWYYQPTALTVAWLEPGFSPPIETAMVPLPGGETLPPTGTSRGRGKWHEKFAARKRKLED